MGMGRIKLVGAARRCRSRPALAVVSTLLPPPLPLPSTSISAVLGVLRHRAPLQPRARLPEVYFASATVGLLTAASSGAGGAAASSASRRAFAAGAVGTAVAGSAQGDGKGESLDEGDAEKRSEAPGEQAGSSAAAAAPGAHEPGRFPPDSSGLELEVGPILADFLAMGAGNVPASHGIPMASATRRGDASHDRPGPAPASDSAGADHAEHGGGGQGDRDEVFRERRVVIAALQPSEPLEPGLHEAPPRLPLERAPALRPRQEVPQLFAEGYAEYAASCQEEYERRRHGEVDEAAPSHAGGKAGAPQRHRVRVQAWHRTELQKTLCRTLLHFFVQETRVELELPSYVEVLLPWERQRAQEYADAGKVVSLVRYLAETELHIQTGPQRAARKAGTRVSHAEGQRIRAERSAMAGQWSISGRPLPEDLVIRAFLDGCMSWRQVRGLLEPPH